MSANPVRPRPARLLTFGIPHDPTIGDLRRSGIQLVFSCCRCFAVRSFDAGRLPFGDLQLVASAHRRMRCSACGWSGEGSATRALLPAQPPVMLNFPLYGTRRPTLSR